MGEGGGSGDVWKSPWLKKPSWGIKTHRDGWSVGQILGRDRTGVPEMRIRDQVMVARRIPSEYMRDHRSAQSVILDV